MSWLDAPWQRLTNALQAERLGHAILFVGASGLGKGQLALRLAARLLCEQPAEDIHADGCGACPSCRALRQGAHAGYQRLSLDSIDAKQEIPVDGVRAACARLALTGAAARARTLIIDRVDQLNSSGFNALLKTLEEPSAGSYLLLVSEAFLDLPATIRSRCQVVRVATPSAEQALLYLRAAVPEASPEACQQALAIALGAPRQAVALLENAELLQRYEQWRKQFDAVVERATDPGSLALPAQREDAAEFARYFGTLSWRRAKRACNAHDDSNPNPNPDLDATLRVAHEAADSVRKIAANAQPRLSLESLMIACVAAQTHASRST